MNNYLETLAKQILSFEKEGISKVRFAKILYFTHKGLVQKGIVQASEMRFIRMPLGPVPVGFNDLSSPDIEVHIEPSSLSYNKQVYSLKTPAAAPSTGYTDTVKKIVGELRSFPTSSLVEISHQEPSWKNNPNGKEYVISTEDLKLSLPGGNPASLTQERDDQLLQAKLVEGMIDDIVEESTSLEYPPNQ